VNTNESTQRVTVNSRSYQMSYFSKHKLPVTHWLEFAAVIHASVF